MSATGRNLAGNERRADDLYETPAWCTRAIAGWIAADEGGGLWLEPSAGSGAIVKAVNAEHEVGGRPSPNWVCVEFRAEEAPHLQAIGNVGDVFVTDFVGWEDPVERGQLFDVAILNPPFSLAEPFIRKCTELAKVTCALLRLNFLGSQKRAAWLHDWTPDVYVLPRRPSFTGRGTDATEYAWFVWDRRRKRSSGELRVLNLDGMVL